MRAIKHCGEESVVVAENSHYYLIAKMMYTRYQVPFMGNERRPAILGDVVALLCVS